jgi:hypothetical protein
LAELQHFRVGGTQWWLLPFVLRFENPDAAAITAVDDAVLLLEVSRDGGVVLNNLAVEIDDGHVALRRVREAHGMEPGVAGGEEFALLLTLHALQTQSRAIAHDVGAVDEVLRGFAHEILAAPDERSAGAGEVAGRGGVAEADLAVEGKVFGMLLALGAPGMRFGDGIDAGVVAGGRVEHGRGGIGVPCEVAPWDGRDVQAGMRGGAGEALTAVGEGHAHRLRATADGLDGAAIGANAEVSGGKGDGLLQMRPGDLTSGPATTEIKPAVRSPGRCIDAALQIAGAKAGEDLFVHVGLVIAVAVLEENDVRCTGDDDAAIRCRDAVTRR